MATVAVLGEKEEARRDLVLAIAELGHRVEAAGAVRETVDLLGRLRPQLLIVACDPGSRIAEHVLGEVDRVQPLLPVVVALERRSASRAVDLMRAGAYEVVAPPWTADNLSACLSKALRFKGTLFEAAPPPEQKKAANLYGFVVLAFLLAAGAWTALKPKPQAVVPPPPATKVWELPFSHPSGLAFHDGELWVSDWFAQTVYRLDPKNAATRRAVHYPKEAPAALALTQDQLWVVASQNQLVRHMLDDRLTALEKVADRAGPTVGLAYDGLYLWTVDGKDKRIHKRLMDDHLTVLDSYDYPGSEPAALAFDGKDLWSLDAGHHELLRHSLEHPGRVTLRATIPEYADGAFRPVGLAWDGERFWSVAENRRESNRPGRVFRHVLVGEAP
ncbi:MAG: hypothetical protein HY925_11110 [Elusimicrobia bacterium]|nr:hypothetical protein [Elusimicrobiota bacterium]